VITAIANQKGGVGKTTSAVNLSAALAARGHRTLLVDLDPQANASLSYVEPDGSECTLLDVLVEDGVSIKRSIVACQLPNLDIVPANIHLAKVESKLMGEIDAFYRLRDKLRPVAGDYDQIVLDTPPMLGLLTVNALVAATHLLVPIQSSFYALEGTDDLLETVEKVKAHANPGLELLGVLVTIFDRRTVLARDIADRIRQVFGDRVFDTVITKSVRLEESPAYKEPVLTFAPSSSGARQYRELALEVIRRGKA
jgi:chromosome partitioning protein